MSPEIALLSETWELVKTHVNTKDRLHVAETMLRLFEENIDIGDIDIYKNEFDKVMKICMIMANSLASTAIIGLLHSALSSL